MVHKILVLVSILFFGCALTSCTSTGYAVADHNGKTYYIPKNCKKYDYTYDDPDTIYCHYKGKRTGQYLRPANPSDVYAHQQRQAAGWASVNESLKNLNENLQQQNQQNRPRSTNCMNLGFGQVSCTTY